MILASAWEEAGIAELTDEIEGYGHLLGGLLGGEMGGRIGVLTCIAHRSSLRMIA